jgi:hypothetical protein
MSLDGIFGPRIQRTALPIGPTLVRLGNARMNAARRPPQHHTVIRNNWTLHSRTGHSNISHPLSANNGAMARIEQLEGSSYGNR